MLQFDIRVTVRDAETREALDDYTVEDIVMAQYKIEDLLDERTETLIIGGKPVLFTIAAVSVRT